MRNLFACFLKISLCLIFVWHLASTICYLLPYNAMSKNKVYVQAWRYIAANFSQNWHFFAPTPGIDTDKLYLGCSTDKKISWFDPSRHVMDRANKVPFAVEGKISYIYVNVAKQLRKQIDLKVQEYCKKNPENEKEYLICDQAIEEVLKTKEYKKAEDFGMYHCEEYFNKKPTSVIITSVVKKPFPFTKRSEIFEKKYYDLSAIPLVRSKREKYNEKKNH